MAQTVNVEDLPQGMEECFEYFFNVSMDGSYGYGSIDESFCVRFKSNAYRVWRVFGLSQKWKYELITLDDYEAWVDETLEWLCDCLYREEEQEHFYLGFLGKHYEVHVEFDPDATHPALGYMGEHTFDITETI